MNNEKRGGIISDLISGVGGLIVLVVITLIIIGTLLGANLLNDTYVTNNTNYTNCEINETLTCTLPGILQNYSRKDLVVSSIVNYTSDTLVDPGNYSVDAQTGVIRSVVVGGTENYSVININYSYVDITRTKEGTASKGLGDNLTTGIVNVSEKIPTILLIGAVVLLFGVLVLLIFQSRRMGIGGGADSQL